MRSVLQRVGADVLGPLSIVHGVGVVGVDDIAANGDRPYACPSFVFHQLFHLDCAEILCAVFVIGAGRVAVELDLSCQRRPYLKGSGVGGVESTQLTVINKGGDHSFENEREILYKILFELRGNVNDMRRDIGLLKKQIEEVRDNAPVSPLPSTQLAPTSLSPLPTHLSPIATAEDAVAEEYIEPVKEAENLNLNDLGKQMLEKALDRNNGNRKKAAQELGISDRTLYRRLKQYGLDK